MFCRTKNTPKHDFFEKQTKLSKTQKLKNVYKYAKISDTSFDQRSLIRREAWFLGGPRISKNQIFLKNGINHQKRKTSKTSRDMPKLAIHPSTRGLSGRVVSTMFCKAKSAKKKLTVQIWDHFFPLLFSKHSESKKILDIQLRELGAKTVPQKWTDGQTDWQTYGHFDL